MRVLGRGHRTLLWALRSPCNLDCKYCYFADFDERGPIAPGELSHHDHADLAFIEMLPFLRSCTPPEVDRVFLVGGEPLLWPHLLRCVETLHEAGCEVIVSTNGLQLRSADYCSRLIASGIDGVCVSLDSIDPAYNDVWRSSKRGDGVREVLEGLDTLIRVRGALPHPLVGVYTVVTALNFTSLADTGRAVASHGADFIVFQPVSLSSSHPLYRQLSLSGGEKDVIGEAYAELKRERVFARWPGDPYISMLPLAIGSQDSQPIPSCFGGTDLLFIEPDGSVWDCPSSYRIAATSTGVHRNIRAMSAAELFKQSAGVCASGCAHFSVDCVNMWQLMGYDDLLNTPMDSDN